MKFEGWTGVFQRLQWLSWPVTFHLPLFEESVSEGFILMLQLCLSCRNSACLVPWWQRFWVSASRCWTAEEPANCK